MTTMELQAKASELFDTIDMLDVERAMHTLPSIRGEVAALKKSINSVRTSSEVCIQGGYTLRMWSRNLNSCKDWIRRYAALSLRKGYCQ